MTNDTDSRFDEWASAWHQDRAPSLHGLRRRVHRAALLNRLAMVTELAVGTAGIAAGAWLINAGSWTVGLGACLFGALGLGISIATRAGSSVLDTTAVANALQTAIDQTRRQYRAALGGLWVCAAALLFTAVVALDVLSRDPSPDALASLVRIQAVTGLFLATAVLVVGLTLVRANRRLAALSRLQDTLEL